MQTEESIAAKLVRTPATNHYNYWSPLACQVDEQENIEIPTPKKEKLLSILTDTSSCNKISAHWARKIENKKNANRNSGHRRNIRCRTARGCRCLQIHRPTINKGVHAPRQEQSTCHQQDATKAQTKGWGPGNEHSPRTTLNPCQRTKITS
jgi:hypothetical protein